MPSKMAAPAGLVFQSTQSMRSARRGVRVEAVRLRQEVAARRPGDGPVDDDQRDVDTGRGQLLEAGPGVVPRVHADDVVVTFVSIDQLLLEVASSVGFVDGEQHRLAHGQKPTRPSRRHLVEPGRQVGAWSG